eukprot:29677-Pelagococcus_subviridis.AAC.8
MSFATWASASYNTAANTPYRAQDASCSSSDAEAASSAPFAGATMRLIRFLARSSSAAATSAPFCNPAACFGPSNLATPSRISLQCKYTWPSLDAFTFST